jgi:glycosyltransferase involved in cell wall biosynthesis
MSNTLVSIIIPTYNRAHLLEETLNSLLSQTYTKWECIVIDDGSLDNTQELVKKYQEKDKRFLFFKRSKNKIKGASTCRNIGLKHAKGEFIQFLDSDDLISSNKIHEQINLINGSDKEIIITCPWARFNKTIGDSVNFKELKSYNNFNNIPAFLEALGVSKGYFPIHAYLIKKTIIDKSGLWNEYLSMNDDSEFLIRLFCNTERVCFAPKTIVYYRWADTNNISNFNDYQKINDAIYSWKLIEAQLKIRFKNQKIDYVDNIKNDLFSNIKDGFPQLIEIHKDFFCKQLKASKLVYKFKNIIITKLNTLWEIVR